MLGGIEAGGTKFICAVGTGPDDLVKAHFRPQLRKTLWRKWFSSFDRTAGASLEAIGDWSFGPVDLDPASPKLRLYYFDAQTGLGEF